MPEPLTPKLLAKLAKRPPDARREYRDAAFGEGGGQLVLRHEPTGRMTWSYVYYLPGGELRGKRPRRRLTIGRYPKVSLADAQRQAREWEDAVEGGEDPAAAVHGDRSFGELWSEFLERYAKPRKKSWRHDRWLAQRFVLDYRAHGSAVRFAERGVGAISRREVVRLLDAVLDQGYGRSANMVKSLLSQVFNFGADRGWIERSPIAGLRAPAETPPRSRILSDQEIAAFLRAASEQAGVRRRCAMPLVLVTAQRPGEVLTVEREEVDLERGLWRLPGTKTKTGQPNIVPLSPLAVGLFADALDHSLSEQRPFLRRKPAEHRRALFYDNDVRALRDGVEARLGEVPHWTPHDLRRTAYSGMTALGVPRVPVVEAVVNHVIPGAAAVYDRYDYLVEKTDALGRWAEHLEDLVEGRRRDNVVPISR
jgi:integrase